METGRVFIDRLLEVLGGVAWYNDSGCERSHHSEHRILGEQAKAQAEILRLVAVIGEERFAEDLLSELRSGNAARDMSGEFKAKVQEWFSKPASS